MHVQVHIRVCTCVEAREGYQIFSLLLSTYSLHRGFITKPDTCHFGLAVELLSSQDPPVSNPNLGVTATYGHE